MCRLRSLGGRCSFISTTYLELDGFFSFSGVCDRQGWVEVLLLLSLVSSTFAVAFFFW